jgi:hypothetical protein
MAQHKMYILHVEQRSTIDEFEHQSQASFVERLSGHEMKRCITSSGGGIDVGTSVDEFDYEWRIVAIACTMQRRKALAIGGIDIGSMIQKQ